MATRAQVEQVMVYRAGPIMAKAGMAVTVAGANTDLADPIAWAVRQVGGATADITNPTTAEVAAVAAIDEMLALSELRLLNNILINLDDVDYKQGPRSEELDQLAQRVAKRIAALEEMLEDEFGHGAAELEGQVIRWEFASHLE